MLPLLLLLPFCQDEYGYRYPCVKARGIIEGSAADVMGMIVDSTRVLEYNRCHRGLGFHFKRGVFVEEGGGVRNLREEKCILAGDCGEIKEGTLHFFISVFLLFTRVFPTQCRKPSLLWCR